MALFLNGRATALRDDRGQQIFDDDFLLSSMPTPSTIEFRLPEERWGKSWSVAVDTTEPWLAERRAADGSMEVTWFAGDGFELLDRSVARAPAGLRIRL